MLMMLTRHASRRDIISTSTPRVFQTINSIPLPQNIAFTPKNLKAGGLFFLSSRAMASKRIRPSSPESGFPTDKQVTRRLMGAVSQSENGVAKDIAGEVSIADYQSMQDDPVKVERMTVQELRTTLRSIGIPAKGCKRDLVTTLKCYLNNRADSTDGADESFKSSKGCSSSEIIPSGIESDLSRKNSINAKNASNKNNSEDDKTSGFQMSRKRGKIFPVGHGRVKLNSELVRTKQNFSMGTEEVSGKKSSISKQIVSSEIRDKTIESSYRGSFIPVQTEPWTILAHMKPKKGWTAYNPKTMRPPPPILDSKTVKLMSWNVNGIRALLKLEGFSALELAEREDFDVLCLQETKLQEKDVEAVKQCLIDGYENSFWTCSVSKLGYSGTAIISRIKPLSIRYGLGIPDHDSEGRLVTAEFDSFYLISGYVPNSGDGLGRLSYRVTEWDLSLSNHMKELEKSKPVILTGDLNCAHQEIDIYNPAGNKRSAGFTIEERQSFEKNFLSRGFVDTFREQHPDIVGYTYWGYRHNCRKTNKGWRLDYFLVSESIADKVHDSYILPDVTGSDHCPIGLTLKI